MKNSFFKYHALGLLMLVTFLLPIVLLGAKLTLRSNRNDVKEWLPASYRETGEYKWFQKNFANETFVLISWDGCTLGDQRIKVLSSKLMPDSGAATTGALPSCTYSGGKSDAGATLTATANGLFPAVDGVTLAAGQRLLVKNQAAGLQNGIYSVTQLGDSSQPWILTRVADAEASAPLPGPKLFTRLMTGQTAVDQMTGPPLNLSENEAISRLRGSLIGLDPKVNQTCVVLTLSKAGKESPRKAVEMIYNTALESGVPKEAIHMGGPPVDNVALDKEGERMLFVLAGLSGAIGLALSLWYMRNGRLTALVLMSSVYGAALSLAIVTFTGNTMDSILLNMPSIVYTMGMSGAIHIINYWRHNAAQYGMEGAASRGLKMAWLPCMLSASTTSLGLISLCTSELNPICKFGFYSALGVMSTLTLLYTFVPSALELWGPKVERIDPNNPVVPDEREESHRRRMGWIAETICSHQKLIWASFLITMFVAGYGLTRSSTTVNLMALFSKNSQIVQSYAWLEDHLGPLVPMEIVVRLDEKTCNLTFLQRLELVQSIQRKVEKLKDVGSSLSAATFAGDLGPAPTGKYLSTMARTRRSVLNKRLAEHRADFLKGDYLAEDDGQELWRINVRVAALKNVDYGLFVDDIKAVVEPVIQSQRDKGFHGIDGITYTGLTPLVYKAQHSLLSGLITSFCWAFVMIAAVMALNFRSVIAGLLCMIPTVWPVAIVFGMLGWLGIDIDIGTMMTAGVAMGVCVDDTLHYGTWFRRALRMGMTRAQATRFAFEHAAKAMYQSNFVVGFGLAAFGVSAFMPTRRFGLLMLALLSFGLMADLLLTPAMMAGPLGYFFSKWWIKPKELEAPTAAVNEAAAEVAGGTRLRPVARPAVGSPSSIPAPHVPLSTEPKIIPLPVPTRRRDQGSPPSSKRGLGK